jgi:type IV fimbrial biogenesis protein FimT
MQMTPTVNSSRCRSCGAQGGFTLIELLVTMVVLAIMMAIGVPSFRNFVNSQRVKSASTELMTAVLIARSEAVKRNSGSVTIAPTSGTDWTTGWSVTVGGATLQRQDALQSIAVTTYTNSVCGTEAAVPSVVFGSSGRPGSSSCFKLASDTTSTTRCVKIDVTGIPSSGSCP